MKYLFLLCFMFAFAVHIHAKTNSAKKEVPNKSDTTKSNDTNNKDKTKDANSKEANSKDKKNGSEKKSDYEKKSDDKEKDNKDKNDKDKDKKDDDDHKSVKIGNLALPSSQQPGPLVSFGENIIDKNVVQAYLLGDAYWGRRKHNIDLFPSILWGYSDSFSIFFNVPFAVSYRDKEHHSSGFEDIFIQFEYAFFNKEEKYYSEQATIVTYVSYPSGSSKKVPPTGFGTPTIFFGATFNHTAVDWFYFTSFGATYGGIKHLGPTTIGTRIGNEYLYEFGFGRNIMNLPGWIFAWMIEFDGVYSERNIIDGVVDPNSGGNVIYMTPSLWISSEHLIVQLGLGCAIQQHLFGRQGRDIGLAIFNLGWTF